MMILGKQNLLLTIKIFSAISVVFLSFMFFHVLNYDNYKYSKINVPNIVYEDNLSCLNVFKQQKFWNLETNKICNNIEADFNFLYSLSENRYVYYPFALFLGAVINVHKIIKVGIF